jgi:hypothetical protein
MRFPDERRETWETNAEFLRPAPASNAAHYCRKYFRRRVARKSLPLSVYPLGSPQWPDTVHVRGTRTNMQSELSAMNIHVGAALVALSIISSIAFAQSLKDKEYFADQEKYLAEEVASTNERCGNSLTAKFDWVKPPAPEQRKIYSAYGYCSAVLEAMRRVCESQAGKDAVKQKIKGLTCSFGQQRTVALRDGTIDYEVSFNSSNDADYVFEYLQNNL